MLGQEEERGVQCSGPGSMRQTSLSEILTNQRSGDMIAGALTAVTTLAVAEGLRRFLSDPSERDYQTPPVKVSRRRSPAPEATQVDSSATSSPPPAPSKRPPSQRSALEIRSSDSSSPASFDTAPLRDVGVLHARPARVVEGAGSSGDVRHQEPAPPAAKACSVRLEWEYNVLVTERNFNLSRTHTVPEAKFHTNPECPSLSSAGPLRSIEHRLAVKSGFQKCLKCPLFRSWDGPAHPTVG